MGLAPMMRWEASRTKTRRPLHSILVPSLYIHYCYMLYSQVKNLASFQHRVFVAGIVFLGLALIVRIFS